MMLKINLQHILGSILSNNSDFAHLMLITNFSFLLNYLLDYSLIYISI